MTKLISESIFAEETQTFDDSGIMMTPAPRNVNPSMSGSTPWSNSSIEWNTQRFGPINRRVRSFSTTGPAPAVVYPPTNVMNWRNWGESLRIRESQTHYPLAPVTNLSVIIHSESIKITITELNFILQDDILDIKLSSLNVEGVCKLLEKLDDLDAQSVQDYINTIKSNNINGRVLLHCDLDELKKLLKMSFGDWEMFKVALVSLREQEMTTLLKQDEGKSVRFNKPQQSTVKPERKCNCFEYFLRATNLLSKWFN